MTVNDEKDIIDNTFNPYAEIDLFSVDGKNHRLDTLLCRFEVKDYEVFFEKIKGCLDFSSKNKNKYDYSNYGLLNDFDVGIHQEKDLRSSQDQWCNVTPENLRELVDIVFAPESLLRDMSMDVISEFKIGNGKFMKLRQMYVDSHGYVTNGVNDLTIDNFLRVSENYSEESQENNERYSFWIGQFSFGAIRVSDDAETYKGFERFKEQDDYMIILQVADKNLEQCAGNVNLLVNWLMRVFKDEKEYEKYSANRTLN